MISKTYTARMNRVHAMLKGLIAHPDQLEKHGATPKFLAALTRFQDNVQHTQEHRRDLKKLSIKATVYKNSNLKGAERLCVKARKWIRREFPPEAWPEFGFAKGDYAKEKPGGVTDERQK